MQHQTHAATAGAKPGSAELTPCESSLLINVSDVAKLLKCSVRHIWRLADSGRMPRPYKIGALCRWDRRVILRWVNDGCPNCRSTSSRQTAVGRKEVPR